MTIKYFLWMSKQDGFFQELSFNIIYSKSNGCNDFNCLSDLQVPP